MIKQNILIIAAEDSSCIYATQFLSHWHDLYGRSSAHFWGVGSEAMVSLGFEALYGPKEMAVVGLTEVVKHYSRLKSYLDRIQKRCEEQKPSFVLLLDYAEFNLKLAKHCHGLGLKVIYWIPPQVWAWRSHRVKQIKACVHKVIPVFPFEVSFFEKHGVSCSYFGHPLMDSLQETFFDPQERQWRRSRYGLSPQTCVIGLMPGSRQSELDQNFSVILEAAHLLHRKNPQTLFLVSVAPSLEIEEIKARLEGSSVPLIVQKKQPEECLDLMDFVIVASGTASLLVGLLEKPMVIVYKMSPLTGWILKKIVKGISYFGLPNLIMNREIVPELFQKEVQAQRIADKIQVWIDDPQSKHQVEKDLRALKEKLRSSPIEKSSEKVSEKSSDRQLEKVSYKTSVIGSLVSYLGKTYAE
jgi:lipid-A-disaccharide synthase